MIIPLTFVKIILILILGLMIGISNIGGLGGGLIAIPYLSFIFKYPTKSATDIAYIFILFGGLGNYL